MSDITQEKISLKEKILVALHRLTDFYGLSVAEIAARTGLKPGSLYNQKLDSKPGSEPMLGALELLLKVLAMERRPMGKLEQIEARIEALEQRISQIPTPLRVTAERPIIKHERTSASSRTLSEDEHEVLRGGHGPGEHIRASDVGESEKPSATDEHTSHKPPLPDPSSQGAKAPPSAHGEQDRT